MKGANCKSQVPAKLLLVLILIFEKYLCKSSLSTSFPHPTLPSALAFSYGHT